MILIGLMLLKLCDLFDVKDFSKKGAYKMDKTKPIKCKNLGILRHLFILTLMITFVLSFSFWEKDSK